VARFINENFVPVKIHIKEQPATFERFGAQWTPTLLVLDSGGTERYRFEGYLPPAEFLAQLETGLAKIAFARGQWKEAQERFRHITREYPDTETAPEAVYWAGVSRYKDSGDAVALIDTAREFEQRYQDSSWARKASVWRP
jgi:hypothetical protein